LAVDNTIDRSYNHVFMPLYLYLLRHGQSADKQVGQTDKDRQLTPTGIKNAARIGDYFKKQNLPLDIIITSAAERTKATSQLVAESMQFSFDKILSEEDLYEVSMRAFLDFVTKLDDEHKNVLCVSHNPSISYLAEYLTQSEIGDMVPAGLVIIKFNFASWKEVSQGNGELIDYIEPEMLEFRN